MFDHRLMLGEKFRFVFVNGKKITGKILDVDGVFVFIKAEGRRVKIDLDKVLTVTRVHRHPCQLHPCHLQREFCERGHQFEG